ncbi:unnamed protein product, partial [Mesorhabditis spiculigera]
MTTTKELDVAPTAVVVTTATLEGKIKFGPGCIVHPTATIRATAGPIEFGPDNIIEELSVIENLSEETMRIGSQNLFEIGCVILARSIGNNNVFGIKSTVGEGVIVTDGCSLGPKCNVEGQRTLELRLCIYGGKNEEHVAFDAPPRNASQAEHLLMVLPRYHKTVKPNT